MKIKIGPVEIEQDSLKDEILYNEYKKSPKDVEKYLVEKSKFFDLTLKNTIAGKTMKMIKNFIFSIASAVFFVGWSLYVFYVSKDAFEWKQMSMDTVVSASLQALFILCICFLPLILINGYIALTSRESSKNSDKLNR